jgi:hypothetical protein
MFPLIKEPLKTLPLIPGLLEACPREVWAWMHPAHMLQRKGLGFAESVQGMVFCFCFFKKDGS